MATRVKARPALHADDLYAWSSAQADLLRAGRFAELDLAHLTLEIEDVGGAMKRAVRNRTRAILEHLPQARALARKGALRRLAGYRPYPADQAARHADANPAPRAGAGAGRAL